MNEIEIMNLRKNKIEFEYDVRVDRYNKILGNKFYMHTENERDLVCNKYKEWLFENIKKKNKEIINELNRIYNIYKKYNRLRLFCWCAPKRCHAETIKKVLELMKEIKE